MMAGDAPADAGWRTSGKVLNSRRGVLPGRISRHRLPEPSQQDYNTQGDIIVPNPDQFAMHCGATLC